MQNIYRVMGWEAMNKELLQMIETDNAGGVIMIAILYMVIAFRNIWYGFDDDQ